MLEVIYLFYFIADEDKTQNVKGIFSLLVKYKLKIYGKEFMVGNYFVYNNMFFCLHLKQSSNQTVWFLLIAKPNIYSPHEIIKLYTGLHANVSTVWRRS